MAPTFPFPGSASQRRQPAWVRKFRGQQPPAAPPPALPARPADPQAAERDSVLDLFEQTRGDLVDLGYKLALQLCQQNGEVTSVQVFDALNMAAQSDPALKLKLSSVDPRWMGAVFRESRGWERMGWVSSGSHKRPVAVWKRRT